MLSPHCRTVSSCTDWQIIREAAVREGEVDLEDYTSAVLGYISKCTEDITSTRTVIEYPNQKPWLNAEVRSLLKARDAAFRSGDRQLRQLTAGVKRAKAAYAQRIQGHFTSNDPRRLSIPAHRSAGLGSSVLTSFYRCVVESVLSSCIIVWHGSCSAAEKKALQRVVKAAQRTVGRSLPTTMDIYTSRCRKRASCIMKDPTHTAHALFVPLPSGRRLRSIKSRTTRLRNSFFPEAVRLLNSGGPL
ncbi:hypothetical protein L3Q82_008975 [Scortum barcoo]|uniref:Uncharacterized protein n=1 Tax=Scortum barcoo TaxID=214431 RepID=A0ACB8XCK4_9TELE|nr:hypothetical protein L3Q82_008975 [Scortum barcoo]